MPAAIWRPGSLGRQIDAGGTDARSALCHSACHARAWQDRSDPWAGATGHWGSGMSSATLVETKPARQRPHDCFPVSTKSLSYLDEIDFHLYTLSGPSGTPLLFCRRGLDELNTKLQSLGNRCPRTLYISHFDGGKFREKLRENLPTLLGDSAIAPSERFQILRSAVGELIERTYRLVNVAEAVRLSREVGRHVVRVLTRSHLSPRAVFQIMEHDYTTFTHLLNVSSYTVLLAQALGIHDESELEEIAVGGMLHDIGKRMISKQILNKPGPLTCDERTTVRTHTQSGYETLFRRKELNFSQLMMVYQHHERWDGGGYPVQLVGREIHPMARLTAVADVFDALTAARPYRKAMRAAVVLEFLRDRAGRHFDREMVSCWTAAFSI
jgi:HD-GYP domain-containing protein (c-di-GMP phosphodiesterase class II)